MAALADRGMRVAPFKVGPDFIDPGHHQRVTGRVSRNLDGWMLSKDANRQVFLRGARSADIAVVEGVMGLFDGYDGLSEAGSTAQISKWLKLPVILVVDARSMSRSAAALVQGFENFDPTLTFAGVIFNRIGSRRHLQYLQEALQDQVRVPCLGGIERDEQISIPERHLGLVTSEDLPLSDDAVGRLSGRIADALDLDRLLVGIPQLRPEPLPPPPAPPPAGRRVRIGVARDRAF
jgi:cobyrinic acid a,c-diamide synthase